MTKKKNFTAGRSLTLQEAMLESSVYLNGRIVNTSFLSSMIARSGSIAKWDIREALSQEVTLKRAEHCYRTADALRKKMDEMKQQIEAYDKEEENILKSLGIYEQIMENGYERQEL